MAVYWIGTDGNAYYKGDDGKVSNYGPADAGSDDNNLAFYNQDYGNLRVAATRIPDPLPGGASQTTTANKQTSGDGTPAKVVNQTVLSNNQKAIDSLGEEITVGNKNIDDDYNSVIGGYDKDAAKALTDFTEGDETNNNNLQKNKQNALSAAAQGRRGLRGTLSAIGALSGDGAKLADRAVAEGANDDIGGAVDTAATNYTALTKAKKNFDDEDTERRAAAVTAKNNSRTALEGKVAGKRQGYYQKMADAYSEGGDTGNYDKYMNMAGDLNNEIVTKGSVQATPITARSAAFTPGDMENYLAGAGDMTVDVRGGDYGFGKSGPSTIVAGRKKEKELKTA